MGALDHGEMVFQTDIVNTMIQVSIKGRKHEAVFYQVLSGGNEKQHGWENLRQEIFVGIEQPVKKTR